MNPSFNPIIEEHSAMNRKMPRLGIIKKFLQL